MTIVEKKAALVAAFFASGAGSCRGPKKRVWDMNLSGGEGITASTFLSDTPIMAHLIKNPRLRRDVAQTAPKEHK